LSHKAELLKFESGTRSSSEELKNLQDRWNKNVSSEKVLNDEERKAVESARALQEAAKRALDEAEAKAKKVEDRKWIQWACKHVFGIFLLTCGC
jgi:hypothetical protein